MAKQQEQALDTSGAATEIKTLEEALATIDEQNQLIADLTAELGKAEKAAGKETIQVGDVTAIVNIPKIRTANGVVDVRELPQEELEKLLEGGKVITKIEE